MTLDEALCRLKALRNETTWGVNERAGAGGRQFGAKMGDIRALAKEIKTDHALGLALWDTGIADARFLAILILKQKSLTIADVERLLRSNDFLPVSDWFNSYILKQHPEKESVRERFMDDTHVIARRAGWSLTGERIQKSPAGLDLPTLLDRLEAEMPSAPEPVQWTMNFALGYIGIHHAAHRARVVAMAEKMGIYRDYPTPKGCTSPFVPYWVAEMVRRGG